MNGFFHHERGYWQTVSDAPEHIRAMYPHGTIEVPLRPGPHWEWDGQAWIEGDKPAPVPATLSPSRFEWLLAFTGLDEVWAALEEAARGSDRATYATLKAMRRSQSFHLSTTLEMVGTFRAQAVALVPDIDLSEIAIRAAWEQAANVKI